MNILGISGRRESGKDTLANGLKLLLGSFTLILSTADWPKQILAECGAPSSHLWGEHKDKLLPGSQLDGREAARRLIKVMRDVDPQCLIRKVVKQAQMARATTLIMPCVRNLADIEGLRAAGGKILRLTRVVYPEDRHPEEIELDDYWQWDAMIDNQNLTPDQVRTEAATTLKLWGWIPS